MNDVVDAWHDAIIAFRHTVDEIADEDFATSSGLPGWTVGDIVAHVAALESELAGNPQPVVEPDWDALPHADDRFSRYTEMGVDARRGWLPGEVRLELDSAIGQRWAQLMLAEVDTEITGVGGRTMTVEQQLRMRCFDIVVHDLDIRDAVGMPAPELGAGARVCLQQITRGLGFVFVKKAGAVPGQVLHVVVPGWVDSWVEVGEDGRGRRCEPGPATVTITVPALEFLRLGSGRGGEVNAAEIVGDVALGRAVLAGMNVAP